MNSTSMTIPLINRSRQTAESVRGSSSCCERCGGLMIGERCMDIGESLGGYWFWVILRNRHLPQERPQEVVRAA